MIEPTIVDQLRLLAAKHNLRVKQIDDDRPWGGEFIFDETQVPEFLAAFFPKVKPDQYKERLAMPKFLIVAPHERFSWQYHERRGELWQVLRGPVGVETSIEDNEPAAQLLDTGEFIETKALMRHRLIGQADWGVVAELWVNTDPAEPSVETDDIRLQDDYGRH